MMESEIPDEDKEPMREELLCRFNPAKAQTFEQRLTPRKYQLNKENCRKLEIMNAILEEFIRANPVENLTDLNSLHYAAAVTLAGERKPLPPRTNPHVPDHALKEQIERIRKWIGRITAFKDEKEKEKEKGKKKEDSPLNSRNISKAQPLK